MTLQPPAFLVTCPCTDGLGRGIADLNISFYGTTRIGTVQLYTVGGNPNQPLVLLIGLPASVPIPIPPGLVACPTQAYANVPTFHIDPVLLTAIFTPGSDNRYWLLIPPQPDFIGLAVHAQSFNMYQGMGTPPYVASAVIGFVIQP